jgi:hypothetical protein
LIFVCDFFLRFCRSTVKVSCPNGKFFIIIMAELATSVLPTDGSVVKMKGLPFKATKEEVVAFYEGFTLVGEQCIKRKQPDGRPNGEVPPPRPP